MEVIEVKVFRDGDKVCCLFGDNIQEGYAGFGDTPEEALCELAQDIKDKGGYPFQLD